LLGDKLIVFAVAPGLVEANAVKLGLDSPLLKTPNVQFPYTEELFEVQLRYPTIIRVEVPLEVLVNNEVTAL